MAGHSRSKNGVASLAYVRPSTSCRVAKTWMSAFAGMTEEGIFHAKAGGPWGRVRTADLLIHIQAFCRLNYRRE
jgi:hypothetical protein